MTETPPCQLCKKPSRVRIKNQNHNAAEFVYFCKRCIYDLASEFDRRGVESKAAELRHAADISDF